jgi:uncharacterized membrane protein YfcA
VHARHVALTRCKRVIAKLKIAGMEMSLAIAGLIVVAYLLAGVVKGVIGMGLPTVAIGILAVAVTPPQAAALLIAPSLVTNIWQMLAGPHLAQLVRRLGAMLLGVCAGAWLGGGILTGGNAKQAALGLGLALIAYAAFGLSGLRFSVPRRAEIWLGPLIGVVTGVITAATGVFVLPALPYLQAIGLEKEDLVQALGLHFTLCTFVLAVVLWRGGAFETSLGIGSLLAVAPALAGLYVGQRIRQRVRLEVFRLCLYLGLLAIGVHLVLRFAM